MIPSFRIEKLEPRFSPARIVAGALPPEFGATLDPETDPGQVDVVVELPVIQLLQEMVVPPAQGPYGGFEYDGSLLGGSLRLTNLGETSGLVKRGAGELQIAFDQVDGAIDLGGIVSVSQLPPLETTNFLGGSLQLGSVVLNHPVTLQPSGATLVTDFATSTVISGSPGFAGGLLSGSFPVTQTLGGTLLVSGATLNFSSIAVAIEGFADRSTPVMVDPEFEPVPEPVPPAPPAPTEE